MEKLGQILIRQGWITPEILEQGLKARSEQNLPLGAILVNMGVLSGEKLARGLAIQLQLPYIQPLTVSIETKILGKLSPRQAQRFRVIPVGIDGERLVLATADPLDLEHLDELREMLNCPIKLAVASREQIQGALESYYSGTLESVSAILEDLNEAELSEYRSRTGSEVSAIAPETMANEAPIIRLVNTIIASAVKAGASDIHLEPFEDEVKVRYRIDGVLQESSSPPLNLYPAVLSRIKLMAGMDITERRLPQDGRIRIKLEDRELDLRVAVAPTLHGEAIVLRILNRESILLSLDQLGLSNRNLRLLERLIARPHGMILVTGPTGSGKTTTLYAALQKLNDPSRKIITIEDPVEYQLKGINQMQVNPKLNFSFAQGLRTIVRHDPDIILVGEIRDRETAEVAIQSALTGHLVFATLHTNDAATAFTRLIDMGVEEFLVASTVCGVLAQRLVRKICPYCRVPYQPGAEEREILGASGEETVLYHGRGCDECNHIGYRGQIGIFEMLVTDEEIERLVMARNSSGKIRDAAINSGMVTLHDDGLEKVRQGITTLAEVVRVTLD